MKYKKDIGGADYLRKSNGDYINFRIKMFPTNCDDINAMI